MTVTDWLAIYGAVLSTLVVAIMVVQTRAARRERQRQEQLDVRTFPAVVENNVPAVSVINQSRRAVTIERASVIYEVDDEGIEWGPGVQGLSVRIEPDDYALVPIRGFEADAAWGPVFASVQLATREVFRGRPRQLFSCDVGDDEL